VIFSHVCATISPITFAMTHFTIFRDWIDSTIEEISGYRRRWLWLLEAHIRQRTAIWTAFAFEDIATDLPFTHTILPLATETQNCAYRQQNAYRGTVHGTVGDRRPPRSVSRSAACDAAIYADWNFAHVGERSC